MFVDVLGRGPDLVLVHGLPQAPSDLDALAHALAATHRVLLVHLPGYGRSPEWEGEYVVESVGAALAVDLRRLGVAEPLLVGFSGGAYRVLQLALDHPDLAPRGIVQLGPLAGQDEADRERFRGTADALDAGVDLTEPVRTMMFSPRFAEAHVEDTARVVRDAMLGATSPAVVATELRAIAAAPDLRPRLGELRVPMLLRVGEHDVPTPPAHARDVAGRYHAAELQVVPGVGHMLHHEDPRGTVVAVLSFDAACVER